MAGLCIFKSFLEIEAEGSSQILVTSAASYNA